MKKISAVLTVVLVLIISSFSLQQVIKWNVKENYSVTFKGGKLNGSFKGLKAIIAFSETDLGHSKIWASIDASSIETGIGLRNKHAISESALNAKQFPLITFESGSITKNGNGYEAHGKLAMKGVIKEVVLPFLFETTGNEAVFKGKFSVMTTDFNITRSGTPDQVDVELIIPVSK